jgi:hypothetical protein
VTHYNAKESTFTSVISLLASSTPQLRPLNQEKHSQEIRLWCSLTRLENVI